MLLRFPKLGPMVVVTGLTFVIVVFLTSPSNRPTEALSPRPNDRLALQKGQRVFMVGNTFAERMNRYGYFESVLQTAYPGHQLVIRNLGWSGDEVDLRPRPANFGELSEHLDWNDAQVIFLFFGLNESFDGDAGLPAWRQRLDGFIGSLIDQKFDGVDTPKLVLVSPIAHEDLGAPLPTGPAVVERNRLLGAYTEVMRDVAARREILFVDLFAPSSAMMDDQADIRLTINGIHLNETGYYHASRWLSEGLGLVAEAAASGARTSDATKPTPAELLRHQIIQKNEHFSLLWRPLSPYYVWGGRAYCWKAEDPMVELERIAQMVDDRDAEIWRLATSSPVDVWAVLPGARELWERPTDYTNARAGDPTPPPELEMVRRNGVIR